MKAADISDEDFLRAVQDVGDEYAERGGPGSSHWANRWDVGERLGFPEKVVLAKARKLINRGFIDGCACGCRGDFELV